MAIQFQFTLNDGEAENLFHYINREISDCHKSIRKEMIGANRQEYIYLGMKTILNILKRCKKPC
jgi:hypothetical protein